MEDIAKSSAVLAVPIDLLWKVSISLSNKFALLALFSLSIFTMIVAILKVALTLRTTREDDSWLYMWAAVEPAVAIIIASAVSYRAVVSSDRKKPSYTVESDHQHLRHGTSPGTTWHGSESHVRTGKSSSDSTLGEDVVPMDGIRVKRDYDVMPVSNLGPNVHRADSNI